MSTQAKLGVCRSIPRLCRKLFIGLTIGLAVSGCTHQSIRSTTALPDKVSSRLQADLAVLQTKSPLFWSEQEQLLAYSHIKEISPTRIIQKGSRVYPLPKVRAEYALDFRKFALPDFIRDQANANSAAMQALAGLDQADDIDRYMLHMRAAGLMVVKDGTVLLERYAFGHNEKTPWTTFSVAKSVLSLLFGAAIQDGYINSVDDLISDYVPHLKGGGYADVSIEQMLQMSSGVQWNEDYTDANSDVARAPMAGMPMLRYMNSLPSAVAPGIQFNYNTGETNIAGAVLRSAIGNNLSAYLSEKVWQPFGMEFDATWQAQSDQGTEIAGCCISATLRDYARIGLFALGNGLALDGTPILPADWISRSVTPAQTYPGYGYLWWLGENDNSYSGRGIFGQLLWIDPDSNMIIVIQSAWPHAWTDQLGDQRKGFIEAMKAFTAAWRVPLSTN